jgi:hypothetical protein
MTDKTYEAPKISVLGEVTDMTQKHGVFFDFTHPTGESLVDIKIRLASIGIDLDVGGIGS